jgi:uncharacterized membrane protein YobD (UPF0266 family)
MFTTSLNSFHGFYSSPQSTSSRCLLLLPFRLTPSFSKIYFTIFFADNYTPRSSHFTIWVFSSSSIFHFNPCHVTALRPRLLHFTIFFADNYTPRSSHVTIWVFSSSSIFHFNACHVTALRPRLHFFYPQFFFLHSFHMPPLHPWIFLRSASVTLPALLLFSFRTHYVFRHR